MGSEGEGGTPKPTARRTLPAFRPATVQNPLPAPDVPAADRCPLPQKLGLQQRSRKGAQTPNPSKTRLNWTITADRARRTERRCSGMAGARPRQVAWIARDRGSVRARSVESSK